MILVNIRRKNSILTLYSIIRTGPSTVAKGFSTLLRRDTGNSRTVSPPLSTYHILPKQSWIITNVAEKTEDVYSSPPSLKKE
ncbi:unnamed protein product [Tenebrio molitor]|nr:unnamed protein product [Tenebrio molitor]